MLICTPTPPTASHDSLLGHMHIASVSASCSPLLRHQPTASAKQHPAIHCFSISTLQPTASATAPCSPLLWHQHTSCRPLLRHQHTCTALRHQHTAACCFGISTLQPAASASTHCNPLLQHQSTASASALCLSASQPDTIYQLFSMLAHLDAACPAWAQAYYSAAHLGTSTLLSSYFQYCPLGHKRASF